MPLPPKSKGELAEIVFLLKAASLGLVVARPWGDNLPFDFLVGAGPPFYRVQVKSTSTRHCRGYHLSCFRPGKRDPYAATEIDFLAAHVVPEAAWYIIPVQALAGRKTITLFPGRPAAGEFEPFCDAWPLLLS
jgi:hypothetical protein